MEVGGVVPRFRFVDREGEVVDAYDFAGAGKPLLIGGGAEDSGGLANAWVAGQVTFRDVVPGAAFRDAVETGGLEFFALATFDGGPGGGRPTPGSAIAEWCRFEPYRCLAEPTLAAWAWTGRFQSDLWILLDDRMVVRAFAESVDGVTDFTTLEAVLFTLLDAP